MQIIDINTWNRKQHFEHFQSFVDPYFAVTIPFIVTKAYQFSKKNSISFFAKYLHDCVHAINETPALKLRVFETKVVSFDVIHASATVMRDDNTFGFSFIEYDENLEVFVDNIELEKKRINTSYDLYPPINSLDCIHCSAMPWLNFTGHKEPISGKFDSVPKLAFGKAVKQEKDLIMNVSVNVNHALVDGYDIALFSEKFQYYLNRQFL